MATLEQLEEARTTRHVLVTQGGLKTLREGDRMMEFTPASVSELEAYINRLERELGEPVTSFMTRVRSRPVFF